MSEINDALKRARQTPPADTPAGTNQFHPLPPRVEKSSATFGWMIPVFIGVLIVAAVFFIVWAAMHRHAQPIASATPTSVAPAHSIMEIVPAIEHSAAAAPAPLATPAPAPTPPAAPVAPKLPKVQGIFYSTAAPTAILDGKTVGVGDQFGDYRVQQISPDTVTLVAADGKEISIRMKR
jgi:hypothetical protein